MSRFVLFTAMLASTLVFYGAPVAGQEHLAHEVSVERGLEKYVELPAAVKRLSIGDTKIIDVSLIDDRSLRVLGLAPGKTTFSLWSPQSTEPTIYQVVVSPNLGALRKALVRDTSLSPAQISLESGRTVMSGVFQDAGSQKRAHDLAAFMTGGDLLDISEVASDKVVQIEVEFAAISKTTLDALGLNFNKFGQKFAMATTAPSTLQSFDFPTAVGLSTMAAPPIASAFNLLLASKKYNFLTVISALKSNNLAQTLAEPTLVVRSGEKADFLVGGEIPIPVPQGGGNSNTITIEYKKFGVGLKIEPTILKNRRIALKIAPQVSELDFSNAISIQGFTIPALRTRETETTVEVTENQPLILAGLMYAADSNVDERVPYLSQIPVIGEFFKRSHDTHETQELVVTVTPRLVSPATQDQTLRTRIRQGMQNISLAPEKLSPEKREAK
jgi:pilus assembly protein CpaC